MKRRYIQLTQQGMVLVELPADRRVTTVPQDMIEEVELDVTDKEWATIHQGVQTGKLDFATVKENHKRESEA